MDGGTSVSGELDLERMRRDRMAKLQDAMAGADLGGLLLLTTGNLLYSTGARVLASDTARTFHQRAAALVLAGDPSPHLFTPWPEGAPPELPVDHLHPPLDGESEAGVADMARRLLDAAGGRHLGRLGVDDQTMPMFLGLPGLLAPVELLDGGALLTDVRALKTSDEIECMRRSWAINEAATAAAEAVLRPGLRLTELSGVFVRHLLEGGATCNFLDPVFQAMPERIADGPWSTNGDVPFNLGTVDHVLSQGEVVWTDTVTGYEGYASDVGRTWVVGRPTPVQRALRQRWHEITDAVLDHVGPGVTGDVLTRVATEANGGTRPWLDHFFLGHGLGLEGGEPQQVGADRGQAYDEQLELRPGMALVVEPVTWEDGHGGWRCEEFVVVTDDGYERISAYPEREG